MWLILNAYKKLCKKNSWTPDTQQLNFLLVVEEWSKKIRKVPFSFIGCFLKSLFLKLFLRKKKQNMFGFYVHGGVGQGKTALMKLIYETCPLPQKAYYHFTDFMGQIHGLLAQYAQNPCFSQPIEGVVFHLTQRIDILFLDEFQVTEIADAMILARLFKRLLEKKRLIFITSNQSPENLYKNGLHRQRFEPFIKILTHYLHVYKLENTNNVDYRQDKGMPLQVFFDSTKNSDHQKLMELFYEETGGEARPKSLWFNERQLIIPQATNTIAFFSFQELCAQPLGAGDYTVIATSFGKVFITHIPVLTAELKNEARRFMLLIDVFYEMRIKLIASFAAPLPTLYEDFTPHALAFERTISRLTEMQTPYYWNS